jgi:hypothetical protein
LAEVVDERAELQRDTVIENAVEGTDSGDDHAGDDDAGDDDAGDDDAPVIHLPDPSLGTDATGEVRKRTRRGSRGGRNRRKKPAGAAANGAVAVVDAEDEPLEHVEPELAVVEDEAVVADAIVAEEESVVEEAVAEEPVLEEPVLEQAVLEEPVVEEPGAEEAEVDVADDAPDGEWTYTPMSDWGLDDRR